MVEMTMASGASRVATYGPRLGFLLLIISLLMLAAAPLGWRYGIWHFRTAFFFIMQYSAYVAVAAAVVSLIVLFWWGGMTQAGRTMAVIGLLGGAFLIYWPVHFYVLARPLPPFTDAPLLPVIHDITTDTEDPPTFSAAQLKARAAEDGNSVAIEADTIKQQKAGYPDIAPLKTALPPDEAFKRALATAQGMSGWTVLVSDPAAGRIEAKQSTLFFGFTDDFVIRVAADGAGSRIDMRSESRQGRSDFGVNAKRVRSYMATLKTNLG
jgi:uncharacterized protein (DUF1499 family)